MSHTIEKTYVYKCDRCGREESVQDPRNPAISKLPPSWQVLGIGERRIDICASCDVRFFHWMESGVSPHPVRPGGVTGWVEKSPRPGEPGSLTINDAKSPPFTVNNPVQFRYPEEQS